MRAAVYSENGPPSVFRYEEVPDPTCLPKGVVIRVEAISVEGGDLLHRAGAPPASRQHVVGYQAAGEIVEVGGEVAHLRVGQKVVTVDAAGSHAELRAVAARNCWVVPPGADLRAIACVPIPFGTADDCLFEFCRLKAGETVLVQGGGGGVGLAAIQLAKRAGATVLATASSAAKLERLRAFGVDHGINYRDDDLVREVKRITQGRGADVIVDPIGGTTLQQSIAALAYRGRIAWVGRAGREQVKHDLSTLMQGNQSLVGVFLGAELATDRVHDTIQRHVDDVAAGKLAVAIDRAFALRDAAAAHAFIESRRAFGRVLLIP
jgi:NADPH2:quinone reductase